MATKADVEALDKRAHNLRRKIQETDALLERKRAGEALEANQLAKLGARREREAELDALQGQRRELLVSGGCAPAPPRAAAACARLCAPHVRRACAPPRACRQGRPVQGLRRMQQLWRALPRREPVPAPQEQGGRRQGQHAANSPPVAALCTRRSAPGPRSRPDRRGRRPPGKPGGGIPATHHGRCAGRQDRARAGAG